MHLLMFDPGSSGEAGPLRIEGDGTWTASVEVEETAATLLDIFVPLRVRERWVVGQLGQSLDGRIATAAGHSHYINGPEDIRRLHRLRALADAVVVGAGTVASDDPRLTVRRVEGPHPVRVVLDPAGRLGPDRRIFTDDAAPTLRVCAEGKGDGMDEVVALPFTDEGFEPRAIVAMLAERGLTRILVEGGGVTVSRFLAAGALDRLHLSVAPLIIGSGRPSLVLPPIETLDEALRPPVRRFPLGRDLLFDLDLRSSGG